MPNSHYFSKIKRTHLYPNLFYFLRDLIGVEWPILKNISTFGFVVIISFLVGILYLRKDFLTKEHRGFFTREKETFLNFQKPIKNKPSQTLGDIFLLAVVFGFIGGKFFYIIENQGSTLRSFKSIFNFTGLNFLGCVIFATVAIWIYYRKNNINPLYLTDSYAVALILSYSIGRLGCHLAGDGDWGIINNYPKPFSFIPDWLWAYDYPHNVLRLDEPIKSCDWGNYCYALSDPVFPTPLYECIICLLIFVFLWSLRDRFSHPGKLAAIFLILSGCERFLIEFIRINPIISPLGISQAQLVSICLVILGAVLYFKNKEPSLKRKNDLST